MTIKRKINNVVIEIELTNDELFDAYIEQERKYDLESCENYFSETYYEEEWYDTLSEEIRNLVIEEAADELRRNIDKYGMSFDYAISDAFVDAIEKFIEGEA